MTRGKDEELGHGRTLSRCCFGGDIESRLFRTNTLEWIPSLPAPCSPSYYTRSLHAL